MSEMVERVADAMMKADWGTERPMPPDAKIKNYYEMSRAAIEAMREPTARKPGPTDGMVHAGAQAWLTYDSRFEEIDDVAVRIWQAMVDAALKTT